MFTPAPPRGLPRDAEPGVSGFMRRTVEQLEALSRYQGVAIQGGTFPTEVPQPRQFITGQIKNEEGGGSGYGSGHFSFSPAGAGFTDQDGYLAYAFDETYSSFPWKGIIVPNGIKTEFATNVSGYTTNIAYPLNADTWEAGANVILMRAGDHWVIVGGVGTAGSGSGHNTFTGTCSDGTHFTVMISGSTVSVF